MSDIGVESFHDSKNPADTTDPELVLWVCPEAVSRESVPTHSDPLAQYGGCGQCPYSEPHFCCELNEIFKPKGCPDCEPLDCFRAEKALSFVSEDWWAMSMLEQVNKNLIFKKFGKSKDLSPVDPGKTMTFRRY